ncbi:hypothetical protein GCM10027019_31080 [Melaminivora jejuensis]
MVRLTTRCLVQIVQAVAACAVSFDGGVVEGDGVVHGVLLWPEDTPTGSTPVDQKVLPVSHPKSTSAAWIIAVDF